MAGNPGKDWTFGFTFFVRHMCSEKLCSIAQEDTPQKVSHVRVHSHIDIPIRNLKYTSNCSR